VSNFFGHFGFSSSYLGISRFSLSGAMSASGFWGLPSANVDWCEQNYTDSHFVAEFYNTLSSIPMVLWGAFGVWQAIRFRLFFRFKLCFALFGMVGVGSTAFHMTLLYSCQLLDELPMILGTLVMVYIILSMQSARTSAHPIIQRVFAWGLVLYAALTCLFMASFVKSPLPMNVSYVCLVLLLIVRAVQIRRNTKDAYTRFWVSAALLSYLSGGVAWLIERFTCAPGLPTQYLHSVWHLLAGYGTYTFILWLALVQSQHLRSRASSAITNRWLAFPMLSSA